MNARRRLVVTTTLVMTVATLMQYSLSGVGPFLTDELRLSDAAFGSLFTVYYAASALGSFALGGPAQRIGAVWGMALVGLFAAASCVVVALAPGLAVIYVGLLFAGVSSALSNPATNLALLPLPDRGPLVGIKQSGVQISALVSGVVVTPLAGAVGWRGALGACGVVCLLALLLLPSTGRAAPATSDSATSRERVPSSILGLAVFAFLMGCGLAASSAYLPLYATTDLGLSAGVGGLLLAVFGMCAVIGRIGWGYLNQHWVRFARPSTALGTMAGGALVAAVVLALASTGWAWLVYPGVAVMGLTGAAWNGLLMTFVMESSEAHTSARAAGRVQGTFFAGLCISPLAFGLMSDATGSFLYVWMGVAGVYLLATAAALTCLTQRRRAHRPAMFPR